MYVNQQRGETWLTGFTKVNQYYNSAKQLPFLQLVTWDDYYEGTSLDTGIDNCLTVTTSVSVRTIKISLTHADTVDHLELWSDNSAWTSVSYPATATSITVTGAGTYYVKVVGKPFIKNVLSSPIVVN